MAKMLPIDKKSKKNLSKTKGSSFDSIFPFGEADRSALVGGFTSGQISPLTNEIKEKDIEALRKFDESF